MKKDISVEELKMIQLKILDSIDDFCKKNGIQYFLFSGTLIGAVRHKGYICLLYTSRGKLCMFLTCLCQRFSMMGRSERKEQWQNSQLIRRLSL